MQRMPRKRRPTMVKAPSMVKALVLAAVAAGGLGLLGSNTAYAEAKLINAANGNAVKDAIQVSRGEGRTYQAAVQEVEVPVVSPYSVVGAGDGWLLDRRSGRIISCYRIGTGYVGERAIRCVSAKIAAVTY